MHRKIALHSNEMKKDLPPDFLNRTEYNWIYILHLIKLIDYTRSFVSYLWFKIGLILHINWWLKLVIKFLEI